MNSVHYKIVLSLIYGVNQHTYCTAVIASRIIKLRFQHQTGIYRDSNHNTSQ